MALVADMCMRQPLSVHETISAYEVCLLGQGQRHHKEKSIRFTHDAVTAERTYTVHITALQRERRQPQGL